MPHPLGTHYPGSQRSSGLGAVLNWGLSLSSPCRSCVVLGKSLDVGLT